MAYGFLKLQNLKSECKEKRDSNSASIEYHKN